LLGLKELAVDLGQLLLERLDLALSFLLFLIHMLVLTKTGFAFVVGVGLVGEQFPKGLDFFLQFAVLGLELLQRESELSVLLDDFLHSILWSVRSLNHLQLGPQRQERLLQGVDLLVLLQQLLGEARFLLLLLLVNR